MGLSVGPRVGPDYIARRRRRRLDQPLQRRGHRLRLRDRPARCRRRRGRARSARDPRLLGRYEQSLEDIYGLYYRVARAFITVISRPGLMRVCVNTGMYSRSLMEWLLRIMGNYLRPDELGPAEAAYRAITALARQIPES